MMNLSKLVPCRFKYSQSFIFIRNSTSLVNNNIIRLSNNHCYCKGHGSVQFRQPKEILSFRYFRTTTYQLAKAKGGKKGGKGGKASNEDNDDDDDDNNESGNSNSSDAKPAVAIPDTKTIEQAMDKKIARMMEEFGKIRAGRASADMFNHIVIDVEGSKVTIAEAAQVTMKSPTKLSVSVYDPALTSMVASAIRECGLGINPTVEGNSTITCQVPRPSKEAREAQVKTINKVAEKFKQDVRSARKDGMDALKKAKSAVSEDITRRLSKEIDTLTEKRAEKITKLSKDKETEIMNE